MNRRLAQRFGAMGRSALLGGALGLLGLATASAGETETSASSLPRPVRWLQEYLQIDTSDSREAERRAVDFFAERLAAAGASPDVLHTAVFKSPGGHWSFWARVRAPGSASEALLLTHHLDVVPAGDGWSEPPFSGRLRDGRVWGRGAIDTKSLGIAQLEALLDLLREPSALERDVVLLMVAGEETGGREGTGWLLEAHPDLLDGVVGVLNEGGVNRNTAGRLASWGIEVAQKRPLWLRVTSRGRGGHASQLLPQSATHRLIEGLARVLALERRTRLTEPARLQARALRQAESGHADVDAELAAALVAGREGKGTPSWLPPGFDALLVDTLQVTQLTASETTNVAAAEASAVIDARLLPDTDGAAFLESVRSALGAGIEVEVLLDAPPAASSPVDGPIWDLLEETLGQRAPLLPIFLPATTDSRYYRARGIPAYGMSPFVIDLPTVATIHAADENIPVEPYLRGVETLRRIVRAWALGESTSSRRFDTSEPAAAPN